MRNRLVTLARLVARGILKRELVFLPLDGSGLVFDASRGRDLLPLHYTYRASAEGVVTYQMQVAGRDLVYSLYTMTFANGPREDPTAGQVCLSWRLPFVEKGDMLRVSLVGRSAWINDKEIGPILVGHQSSRKFIAELQLSSGHHRLTRLCSHYLPFDNKSVGRDYYFGDDYVDYPQETNVTEALNLVRQFCSGGRLLDVGCALGIYTKAFLGAGFDAYGVDVSEFAIKEAGKAVGDDRVRVCNLDTSAISFGSAFDIFWMQDVLEHSSDPQRLLEKVTERASPGAWLFLHTSNAESLSHRILGRDWEGYSDYSHYGVDSVSATGLADWLKRLGWQIVDWQCADVWVAGVDPVILRLREAFHRIPELRVLLAERDLGDLIRVVATKHQGRAS